MSRWVQLTDPPEWPGAGTRRGRERDRVLALFELRRGSGSPTSPSGFAALFEVDADQILRMAVFLDRQAALRALKNEAHELA